MKDTVENLVQRAIGGDRAALEETLLSIKDYVYNLSLKMLLYPEDAKDATQEILIRIVTHLSTFKAESSFTTWVYRVASNYLLTETGKKTKAFTMPFEDYALLIDTGRSDQANYTQNEGELALLEEEVKVSCTQGLLLCLNASDRMVYVLADILEFNSTQGAEIMSISAVNFRKKLSRSREKIRNFLNHKCGLVNANNPCRCVKKIDFLIDEKIVDPKALRFAPFSKRSIDLVDKLADLEKSIAIYRSVPNAEAPKAILNSVKQALTIV